MRASVRIGTSGWNYKHWRGAFYPDRLRSRRLAPLLRRAHFDACEINGSFYRLPTEAAVAGWAQTAPPGFVFAWKVSRYLTHAIKLKDPADSLALIFGRMRGLGAHAGPALFQLPPQLRRNDERLAGLLERLPGDFRHAIEFRHPSWYAEPVYDLLRAHGSRSASPTITTRRRPGWKPRRSSICAATDPAAHYRDSYPDATLRHVGRAPATAAAEAGREVHAYFDNDIDAHAPRDAVRLRDLLAGITEFRRRSRSSRSAWLSRDPAPEDRPSRSYAPSVARSITRTAIFERIGREQLIAVRRHQHLLLQLDPVAAAGLAHVALDADRHAFLEHPLIAGLLEVLDVHHLRPLVAQPDPVQHRGIPVGQILLRDRPGLLREF